MAGLYTGDKQISGDLEQARVVSRKKPHRDLDLSLKIHPIRKDIIPLKDDAAVKNAVKNLLITNFSSVSSKEINWFVKIFFSIS